MVLIKKNLSNEKNLEVDNLTVVNGLSGNFNIAPSNIQTSPPNSLTVNEISKLINRVGELVDTGSTQTIQADKTFNGAVKTNIVSGYISIRQDCTPNLFVHNFSYDFNKACLMLCTSDDSVIQTGFCIGYKNGNIKSNPSTHKFGVTFLSAPNSTKINVEEVPFVSMNSTANNRLQLKNLDSVSIGSDNSNLGAIYIKKNSNAEINVVSETSDASLSLQGGDVSEIKLGNNYRLQVAANNPESFKILKSPSVSFLDYNLTSGCLSLGDNNGSTNVPYQLLNLGIDNKVLKLPYMNASQQNIFVPSLSGSAYQGSLYFNRSSNRLCFTDSNNVLHQVSGSTALSSNDLSVILESPNNSSKLGTIVIDDNQLNQNNNVYMPYNTDVHLRHLENVTSNVQTQINNRVTLDSVQTITGQKTFESSTNNSNDIVLKNAVGSINGLSFVNQFSPSTCRILKHNDDLRFIVTDSQKMSLRPNGDLNLDAGNFLKNEVNIAAVAETLTNKTIAYSSNTPTGFMSLSTSQTCNVKKTWGSATPFDFNNSTESRLSYIGATNNYSIRQSSSGYNFFDDTANNSMISFNNTNGINITATGKLKVNGNNVYRLRNSTTTNPSNTNDSSQGYEQGSEWYNTTTKSRFICSDATLNNAVWFNTNIRQLTHQPYTATTVNFYEPWLYFYAGNQYYNNLTVNSYCDGNYKLEIFNVTTSSLITESATYSGGNNTNVIILGPATKFPPDTIIRLSVKILTGATIASIFCTRTD